MGPPRDSRGAKESTIERAVKRPATRGAKSHPHLYAITGTANAIVQAIQASTSRAQEYTELRDTVHSVVESLRHEPVPCFQDSDNRSAIALNDIQNVLEGILEFLDRQTKRTKISRGLTEKDVAKSVQNYCRALRGARAEFSHVLRAAPATDGSEDDTAPAAATIGPSQGQVLATMLEQLDIEKQHEDDPGLSLTQRQLPSPPHIFIGRDDIIEDLLERIMQDVSPMRAVILGAPGVGKSALALRVLHDPRAVTAFGPQRLFFRCDACTSASGLITGLGAQVGIIGSTNTVRNQLVERFKKHKTILVLDNFETPWESDGAQQDVEAFLGVLAAIPTLTFLVTMRGYERPLGTQWSQPFLPPIQPFDRPATMETFLTISGLASDDPQELRIIDKLLDQLDGVPLAVTLMGNLAQYESPNHLLARWDEEMTSMLTRGYDTRASSLDVSIQLSLASPRVSKTANAKDLLSVLSLLPDGLVPEPALLSNLFKEIDQPSKALAALQRSALAFLDMRGIHSEGDLPRVRVLAPIRAYMIRYQPPPSRLLHGLQEYYKSLADQCVPNEFTASTSHAQEIMRMLSPEAGNLMSLVNYALDHQVDREWAVQAALKFDYYLRYTGSMIGKTSHLTKCMDFAKMQARPDVEIKALLCMVHRAESYPEKRKLATNAVLIAEAMNDVPLQAKANHQLAIAESDKDKKHRAFRHTHDLYVQLGDEAGEAQCLHYMALASKEQGLTDLATKQMARCLEIWTVKGHDGFRATCLRQLGEFADIDGKHDDAFAYFQEALALGKKVGATMHCGVVLLHLGQLATLRSDIPEALEYHTEARALFSKIGDSFLVGAATLNQGQQYAAMSDIGKARECFDSSMEVMQKIKEPLGLATCWRGYGDLSRQLGDLEEAAVHVERARDILKKLKNPEEISQCESALADVVIEQGKIDDGVAHTFVAILLMRRMASVRGMSVMLPRLGNVLLKLGDIKTAVSCFTVGLSLCRPAGLKRNLAECLKGIGDVRMAEGRTKLARKYYEEALEVAQRATDKVNEARILGKLEALA